MDYTISMKLVWTLLLALLITVNAYASTAQVPGCCPDTQCDVAECVEMGCLPVANPVGPASSPLTTPLETVRDEALAIQVYLTNRCKEVWTPPD